MTRPDRNGHGTECGVDLPAYALGALEPAEAEALRRHIETCVVCRDELASFQQLADILPLSAPQHRVSNTLRRRVLAEVRRDAAGRDRPSGHRSWRLLPSFARSRPALALGVLLAVVIAVGGLELVSSAPSRSEVFHAQVVGSSGSADVRLTNGHAELVVRHLAPPPAGQVYEVWLARPNRKPQPARALFTPTASGGAVVNIPSDLDGIQQLMVTSEPAGGSAVPTHPAVITADLL